MRSSSNVYNQSLIAYMILNLGEKETEDWIKNLVNNFARKPFGGDRDQIKAIASGQCDITVANTYYLANMLNSKNKKDVIAAEKVSIFWPNQETFGAHINISGAGILKSSKNFKNALMFLEFLSSHPSDKKRINGLSSQLSKTLSAYNAVARKPSCGYRRCFLLVMKTQPVRNL